MIGSLRIDVDTRSERGQRAQGVDIILKLHKSKFNQAPASCARTSLIHELQLNVYLYHTNTDIHTQTHTLACS